MSDIVAFITARLDEAEAPARAADAVPAPWGFWDDTRVLAVCGALRRIVALHRADGGECGFCSFHEAYEGFNDVTEPWPCEHLRTLASIWSAHPDFDPAWRSSPE